MTVPEGGVQSAAAEKLKENLPPLVMCLVLKSCQMSVGDIPAKQRIQCGNIEKYGDIHQAARSDVLGKGSGANFVPNLANFVQVQRYPVVKDPQYH